MRRLHETQPPVLAEGDVPPGEFQLEGQAVMRGPEEDRLATQFEARFPVFQHLVNDRFGLLVLVLAGEQVRLGAAGPLGPQVLGVPFGRSRDHLVGGVQNGLGTAVVLLQGDDARPRELPGEVEDVPHGGGPERVDGLGVVPDRGEVLAPGAEHLQDLGLKAVGVLILVDQDAIEPAADGSGGSGIRQQAVPEEQEVVIVEDALPAFVVDIGGKEAAKFFDLVFAPGEARFYHFLHGLAGVDATAVNVHAGALEREAAVVLGETQVGAEYAHEVLGVGAV